MWINFKNLLSEDLEEVVSAEKIRINGHIMSTNPNEITFQELRINKITPVYVVAFRTESANDPKLQFLDKDKAEAYYAKLCNLVIHPVDYIEIDAIAEG